MSPGLLTPFMLSRTTSVLSARDSPIPGATIRNSSPPPPGRRYLNGKSQPRFRPTRGPPDYMKRFLADTIPFFFTNFPEDWFPVEMRRTFQKLGEVRDLYVAQKRDYRGNKFGFVRFRGNINPSKMEEDLNNIRLGSFKLKANLARFDRAPSYSKTTRSHSVPLSRTIKGKSFLEASGGAFHSKPMHSENSERKFGESLSFQTRKEESQWLEGCLVGVLHNSQLFQESQQALSFNGFPNSRLIPLGGASVLIYDENRENLSVLLNEDKDWLGNWFKNISYWNREILVPLRTTWISCIGIPPHAWNARLFNLLTTPIGKIILISEETVNRLNLACGRFLVETSSLEFIHRVVQIDIDGVAHSIRLLEEGDNYEVLGPNHFLSSRKEVNSDSLISDSEYSNDCVPETALEEGEILGHGPEFLLEDTEADQENQEEGVVDLHPFEPPQVISIKSPVKKSGETLNGSHGEFNQPDKILINFDRTYQRKKRLLLQNLDRSGSKEIGVQPEESYAP